MNSVIIAAAGVGLRAKTGKNKILFDMGCLSMCLSAFKDSGVIDEFIVAARPKDIEEIKTFLPPYVKIAEGGATRTESVKNALSFVTGDVVLIHDAARPYVSARIIKDCCAAAKRFGGAVTAVPSTDTVCKADENFVCEYCGKKGVFSVQTPQAFLTDKIKEAYAFAGDKSFNDDGEVYKNRFGTLAVVEGERTNVKLTYPEDFNAKPIDYRFGTGFDCHKLVPGRKLILGGVTIPHEKGLLGHSDADVLTHAVMDAIFSACAMRDIGYWFPDTDEKYKDADSMLLLKKTLDIVGKEGFRVKSVSACIMAERPKLKNIIPDITKSLAAALNVSESDVGISATTLEGLGFVGREEGICVHATATVEKRDFKI